MPSALWKCNECESERYLPAVGLHMCEVCNKPLFRARNRPPQTTAPALPARPGARPSAMPPAAQAPAGGSPMHDFFNVYCPTKLRGQKVRGVSGHNAYLLELSGAPHFLDRNGYRTREQAVKVIKELFLRFRERVNNMAPFNIILSHVYMQKDDIRIYQWADTMDGWCIGIAAHWLKQKKSGVNIFPDMIYSNPELSSAHGAPVKLMTNIEKMIKHKDLLSHISLVRFAEKNALDYIAGEKAPSTPPVVDYTLPGDPRVIEAMARKFYATLAPRFAPQEKKAEDLFLVTIERHGGGARHMIALDMNDVELFEPNYGVFKPKNQSREKLVIFLFQHLSTLFYRDKPMSAITIFKVS